MDTIHEDPHALSINTKNHLITAPHAPRWYSLVINPLLQYQIFYGGMAFFMVDWNRREDHERGTPWAQNVFSDDQWDMLLKWHKEVLERRKRKKMCAVVVMHPAVFNPFPEMGDRKLRENPETHIFYESFLIDTYTNEDLVDGTFRLKRNEFIRMCLGNDTYGEEGDYRIFPEKGIDIILNGHVHRSGFFQVEGPHVYLRTPETITEGPLFCNSVSSGPIGIKNEEGGLRRVQPAPPGYHSILFDKKISVAITESDMVAIREETRRDYGEIAKGNMYEVKDAVSTVPRLGSTYVWKVTNLKEGSTITRIRIDTGLSSSALTVKSIPLGWRHTVEKCGRFTVIVCEAHDRVQGILHGATGEISIRVEHSSAEKMGTLAVSWDMNEDPSLPVCVRAPADQD
jgi:hypothetical protein